MSAHLLECPQNHSGDVNAAVCACPALRACEQRAREEQASAELALREQTWLAALDAARDAVAALYDRHDASCDDPRCEGPDREFALAAIDALRGES